MWLASLKPLRACTILLTSYRIFCLNTKVQANGTKYRKLCYTGGCLLTEPKDRCLELVVQIEIQGIVRAVVMIIFLLGSSRKQRNPCWAAGEYRQHTTKTREGEVASLQPPRHFWKSKHKITGFTAKITIKLSWRLINTKASESQPQY